MEIQWHQPNTTTTLKIKDYPTKRREWLFLEMPCLKHSLASLFDYEVDTSKMVCCVPLFFVNGDFRRNRHLALQGFIKRAFWLAYELATYTDLIKTQTGFYMLVDEEIRPLLEPYRQLCEFPEDRIISISGLETWKWYMPMIAMLKHLSDQTAYTYYFKLNTQVFFNAPFPLCQNLLTHWESHPDHVTLIDYRAMENPEHSFRCPRGTDPAKFYVEIPKFFGYDSYDFFKNDMMSNPYNMLVNDRWMGMPRTHLKSKKFEDFYNFVKDKDCNHHSESFLILYWYRYYKDRPDIYKRPKGMEFIEPNLPDAPSPFYTLERNIEAELYEDVLKYYSNANEGDTWKGAYW